MIGDVIDFLLRASRWLTRRLTALQRGRESQLPRDTSAQRAVVAGSTDAHDMARHPDESYYREQYWHWIARALERVGIGHAGNGLDLGCGQGRLTLELARWLSAGTVCGVDISAPAIEHAKRYAHEANVTNIDYRQGAIADIVREFPAAAFDVVLFTEVSFYYPAWREDLEYALRALRPGGVLLAAFRPLYYDALMLVKAGMFEQVDLLLQQRHGRLFGGNVTHTWQTAEEIRQLIATEFKMELLELVGIGCCSGLEDDLHAGLARPSLLNEYERTQLMRLETALGPMLPDTGRYLLVAARKNY